MVQNAGFVLKDRQSKRRENFEIVVIYLYYNQHFRWKGVENRATL